MLTFLIAFTLLFPFLYKYSFVITNQFSQIPIILAFMDPKFLANDWYVNVSRNFGPRTVFAFYMAQSAKLFSLPFTFFIHYFLYILLVVFATYRLSLLIFKNKFIAVVTVIAVLYGTSITLGGNILITADLSAPQLPLALTLLGITLLLEKKYVFSSLLFAASAYLHPLIGLEAAIIFGFIYFYLLSNGKVKWSFIKKWFLPFILTTLPIIILYLKEGTKSEVLNIAKLQILAFMRNPHHFLLSTWPLIHFIHFFVLLVVFIFFLLFLKSKIPRFIIQFFALSAVFILLNGLIGFIGTEIISSYPLTVLQPFRLTLYLYWLSAVIIFGSVLLIATTSQSAATSIFLLPIFLSNLDILEPKGKIRFLAIIFAFFLLILFKKIPKRLFITFLIIYFSLFKFHDKFNYSSYINYPTEETTVALWAKENTPPNAIFLIPTEFEKFRLISQRAIVADWKSFPFQETAMLEWAKRMCDLGNKRTCNYKEITSNQISMDYRLLTDTEISKLAVKYGAQYIITDVDYFFLNKIYSNRFYVYRL